MSLPRTLLIIFLQGVFLLILSCQDAVKYEIIEFDQPSVPNIDLFELELIGMDTGSAEKYSKPDKIEWNFDHILVNSQSNSDWDPVSTAMMYVHDYFRRGMLNNLRWIYSSTFDMAENNKPVQNENIFTWNYNSGLYDPNKGMILIETDVILVAKIKPDQWIEWTLYRKLHGEDIIIATGLKNRVDKSGEWIFYHHNNSKQPAYKFKWKREKGSTTSLKSTLYFADVTSQYQHQNERINLEMDIKDNPESPVYTDINWNRETGEGQIQLKTNTIDQLKCWDDQKIETDVCPS